MELGFSRAMTVENGCCTAWLPCYHFSPGVFGEVEGDVQPLHLSPIQMLGEAEADEHTLCVFVWVASEIQGFCFAKGPFLAW